MSDYYLTCDSTVDLTPEQLERRQIRFVSFHFELDGKTYDDDMGRSMPSEELFRRIANGASTRTSHPSQSEYIELFEGALSEGKDVLHISFSSGLSGGWNTACLAQEELREKYPDRRLYVVDSLGASSGSGLIMETLADMRDAGADIDTLYAWIEANKLRMHHWFFSTDLSFYVRGGRISRAAGTVGTLLHICPLLNMNDAGLLTPREKIRTKRKTMRRTVEMMEQHAEGGLDYSGKCYLCHSICPEDAEAVAHMVEERFTKLNCKVQIYPIGATIGSHTGPGTVSLFFWGDLRGH